MPRKRLPTPRDLPRTVRSDVFIWHNHIMHTTHTSHGERGFRYHYKYKPVNSRKFMRCKCGWSGLPHYSVRGFASRNASANFEIAKPAAGQKPAIKFLQELHP
jgi:hypothetical protein